MTSLLQTVAFPERRRLANLVHVDAVGGIPIAIRRLGFSPGRPVMVVVGGASRVSDEELSRIERLFQEVLAPVAQACGAVVVDGGTDAGVMKLMGRARRRVAGQFPLVGVSPSDLSVLPGKVSCHEEAAPLEPNHTHFVLVKGSHWGDESKSLARVASLIAGSAPSVAIVVNGGEVTLRDAECSVEEHRALWVIEGSGRTADRLVAASHGHEEERLLKVAESGLLQAWHLDDLDGLRRGLMRHFGRARAVG
jgi:SLOG in TRPM, prokaryote